MTRIYIIDLGNRQEEYAAALEFIKSIENERNETFEERKQRMIKIAKRINVLVVWILIIRKMCVLKRN